MTVGVSTDSATAAGRLDEIVRAALAMASDGTADALERADMLTEIAMGLQRRPKTPDHLRAAVQLYDRALSLCPDAEGLPRARILARKATALQAIPDMGDAPVEEARAAYAEAIPVLERDGRPEEVAEAEMNLGLVLHHLAGSGRAPLTEAIAAYQRSLRTFDRARYPVEFAILQNNLATAFLSIPLTDERAKVREAMAVQCFEEALKVVTLVDHPSEYAMLQNNLGNALQYASSSHAVENNIRAIAAYDEALRVRTRERAPVEYANTISNKANCLWNLPDDPERPERGNAANLRLARDCYSEAREIFAAHGEAEKARIVAEALDQIERDMLAQLSEGAAG